MKRFMIAACAALTLPATALAHNVAGVLSPQEFNTHIVGKTLTAKVFGFNIKTYFKADGTMLADAGFQKATGIWAFNEDGEICVEIIRGPKTGNGCGYFYDQGNGTQYRGSQGRVWTLVD